MKKFLLFFFLSSFLYANTSLPAPYSEITPMPFVDHGWFNNKRPLGKLIKKHKPTTIIEVGSWLGKSTIFLAKHVSEGGRVYAIDHWLGSGEHFADPELAAFVPTLYEQFLSNIIHAGLTGKVIPIKQDSLKAAQELDCKADLIYIDAGHETEAVYKDLTAWLDHLAPNGVLCGDDWLWDTVRVAVEKFAEDKNFTVNKKGNFWWYEKKL